MAELDVSTVGASRRALLLGAATAGAAAWVVPSVLATPAANASGACGTCLATPVRFSAAQGQFDQATAGCVTPTPTVTNVLGTFQPVCRANLTQKMWFARNS